MQNSFFFSTLSKSLLNSGIVSDASLAMNSTTFGTDQTAAIQAILDLALTQPLYIQWDVKVSTTGLKIHSNTTINALEGCGAILRNGANAPVLSNKNPKTGTITDKNISINGGVWNGNGANQIHSSESTGWIVGMRFMGVENLRISNLEILAARTFAMQLANWKRVDIRNVSCFTYIQGANSDGLHINGPGQYMYISNLKGNVSDDLLALLANDITSQSAPTNATSAYGPFAGPGDIFDVIVDGVTSLRSYNDEWESRNCIRLLTSTNRLDRVIIKNVIGNTRAVGLIIDNYSEEPNLTFPNGVGNFGDITLENLNFELLNSGAMYKDCYVFLNAKIENLKLKDIVRKNYTNPYPYFKIASLANIDNLIIEGFNHWGTGMNVPIMDMQGGTINNLQLSDVNIQLTTLRDMPLLKLNSSATVNRVNMRGINCKNINNIVDSSGTLPYLSASNVVHTNATSGQGTFKIATGKTVTDCMLSNYYGFTILSGGGTITTSRGDGFTGALPIA